MAKELTAIQIEKLETQCQGTAKCTIWKADRREGQDGLPDIQQFVTGCYSLRAAKWYLDNYMNNNYSIFSWQNGKWIEYEGKQFKME